MNQAGLDLIKRFEGLKLRAYKDLKGIWTIGYGCTGNIKPGASITEDTANQLLLGRIKQIEDQVSKFVKAKLSPNQHSALICLAYNIGAQALAASHLVALINEGNFKAAADEFLKWIHVEGKEVPGLITRREAERELFQKN